MSKQEIEALIEENKDVIPEWLVQWVRGLSLKAARRYFEELRRNLPASRQQSRTKARASSRDPGGELPEKDREAMDRIFGNRKWASEPITVHPDGRVTATALARRRQR